jgi:IS30 family transposase
MRPHNREGQRPAIGTFIVRATHYVMLVHLPDDRITEHMRDALVKPVQSLPSNVARSLTWDQGSEIEHLAAVAAKLKRPPAQNARLGNSSRAPA